MKIAVAIALALVSTVSAAGAQAGDTMAPQPLDFGAAAARPGLSGSVDLGYSADPGGGAGGLMAGGTLRYAIGQITQSLSFKLDLAEAKASRREIFAVYDLTFDARNGVYGFVTGRTARHGLAATADDIAEDSFIGFGPGYRLMDTGRMAWRVQAGIGASYLKDGAGAATTEPGVIASSRFLYEISAGIWLSDDADVLKTASSLRIDNDLGVSLRMSDGFATRISYLADYNDRRADRTDNRLGLSLVMRF